MSNNSNTAAALAANIASLSERLSQYTHGNFGFECTTECTAQVKALATLSAHIADGGPMPIELLNKHRDIFEQIGAIGYRSPLTCVEAELRAFYA